MKVQDKVRMVKSDPRHPVIIAANLGKVGVVDAVKQTKVKVRFGTASVGVWVDARYLELTT